MQLLIIVLAISFIVFLFGLHVLAKEDLVFVRKNITMEALFNLAFFTAGISLLAARLVYIMLHPSFGFLNPLVFLLVPYFPGLSLPGGLVGGMLFLYLYKRKKYPSSRIFDFFGMAFLGALPIGFFGAQVLEGMHDLFSGLLLPGIFIVMLLFFVKVLLPLNIRGEIKDGSLGYLFVFVFSFTTLLAQVVRSKNIVGLFLQVDTILLVLLVIFAITMLVIQEKEIPSFKRD